MPFAAAASPQAQPSSNLLPPALPQAKAKVKSKRHTRFVSAGMALIQHGPQRNSRN